MTEIEMIMEILDRCGMYYSIGKKKNGGKFIYFDEEFSFLSAKFNAINEIYFDDNGKITEIC